jgi:hypothetical protein
MAKRSTGDHSERIRRLRLGDLRRLFWERYGPRLPDDDAGREDLRELLLAISTGPNADIKVAKAIEVWAEWMSKTEAQELIDDINRTPIWQRKPNATLLGQRLQVTNAQRERLRLWTIAACDMTQEEAAEWRKAKERARKRKQRELRGRKPQSSSINRTKPWLALGVSRTTWYRQGGTFRRRETVLSEVKVLIAADKVVPPQQPNHRGLAMGQRGRRAREKHRRLRSLIALGNIRLDDVTAREHCGQSCLTMNSGD